MSNRFEFEFIHWKAVICGKKQPFFMRRNQTLWFMKLFQYIFRGRQNLGVLSTSNAPKSRKTCFLDPRAYILRFDGFYSLYLSELVCTSHNNTMFGVVIVVLWIKDQKCKKMLYRFFSILKQGLVLLYTHYQNGSWHREVHSDSKPQNFVTMHMAPILFHFSTSCSIE